MVQSLGGRVEGAAAGEFGRTPLTVRDSGRLLVGLPSDQQCWMSHRDTVFEPPPGFTALASSPGSPVAACESPDRGLYGIQFHPEVVHTPYGTDILTRFLRDIAGCVERWSPTSVIEEQVERIRAAVGDAGVVCGLSGGVDSATAAALVHRAVGDQLTCVLVDHGLLRKNEAEQVAGAFREGLGIPLVHVDAADRFLDRLAGVTDPELKRKIVGEEFIRVFEEEAAKLTDARFLVQGTLYSDVIESGGRRPRRGDDQVASQRRRPARGLGLDLVEPLRMLFKDEVRAVAAELGLPDRIVWRQPFPGPGLGDSRRRRRGHAGTPRHPARSRRDPPGGDPRRGAVPRAVAVVLRAAGRALGGSAGRRAHLRVPDRDPRRHLPGRDDRRLGAAPLRPPRAGLEPDHQRDPPRQPRHARHLLEAALDDRVGVAAARPVIGRRGRAPGRVAGSA